jgi:hypothetical protein
MELLFNNLRKTSIDLPKSLNPPNPTNMKDLVKKFKDFFDVNRNNYD